MHFKLTDPRTNWKFIAIVVCFAVLVGGGTLWYVRLSDQQISQLETSNWQTYRNEEFGFELRYPSNWRVNTLEVGEGDFIQIDNYLTDKEGGEKTMQILSTFRFVE